MSLHYHIVIFAVIATIHLQSCYLCYGFTTTQAFKSAVPSRSGSLSTALSSTASSQQTHQVIATSPALGGDIIRINSGPDEDDSSGFLTALGVPTYAVLQSTTTTTTTTTDANADAIKLHGTTKARRLGLEGVLKNSNAFLLEDALSPTVCESILNLCEDIGFGEYNAGKNNHGALQIVIAKQVADALMSVIGPHVDLKGVIESNREVQDKNGGEETKCSYSLAGINRRFRVYRYAPGSSQTFAPHIDAGFPPGGVSLDDDNDDSSGRPYLHWDATHQYSQSAEIVSRLTVLIYLNDDFTGGHTKFYAPVSKRERTSNWNNEEACDDCVIASVQPRAGSVLVFPQAVSEEAVERARLIWPLHEGSKVSSGNRAKYVIRTDVLFETIVQDNINNMPEAERVLFQHDDAVREVFLPTSQMYSPTFLHHVQPLYNPHMGVENAGHLLYSLVRFTKSRKVVEVGAGYTTLFLLQALKDNEDEMKRIIDLDKDGRLRLLDYPFGIGSKLEEWDTAPASSLLCIDNCEHQKETASGAVGVARTLGLDSYLEFLRGDAFDALDTHFSETESIDLLWCDFGVGSRMKEYAASVWKYIKPGGFLCCHSTLTNRRTREWLESIRQQAGEEYTGIPSGEYVEVSLLEPHKRYQNSITVLQKRIRFEEPIYSEYA
jgi:predicted O-methyltransferase YrrM